MGLLQVTTGATKQPGAVYCSPTAIEQQASSEDFNKEGSLDSEGNGAKSQKSCSSH